MEIFDTSSSRAKVQQRAGAREWIALAVLMLPVLLTSIDNTVLTFALPQVSKALNPTGTQLLWLVDLYPLMMAGLLVAMGSLGDRIGRRRLLLIGSVGFGITSLIAAYSPNAETLLTSRALLGVFGATLMPSTLSLIRNIFTNRADRRIAIATWAAMFSGGAALGPIVGGYLLEHFWWGSIFLINVPIIIAFVVLALIFLPESRDPKPGRVDLPAIVLSMTAMLPIVYAIKTFASQGFNDVVLAALAISAASVVLFVRRMNATTEPMIDMSLFGNRVFAGAITANLLSLMGFAGFLFFAAQFLQLVMGLSPMLAATTLIPGLIVTVIAGFLAVKLVRFVSIRALVTASFVLSAGGYALATFAGAPSTLLIVIAFAVLGGGIGLAETLTNDVMLSTVPADKAGSASALSETAYEIGAVLGTAVLGSILTATYRDHLTVPATLRWGESLGSFETLGSTVEVAQRFPNASGEALLSSAHHAFEMGVHRTSMAAIVVALLAGLVAWRTLAGADRD